MCKPVEVYIVQVTARGLKCIAASLYVKYNQVTLN